jgi:hypothetical protein
MLSIGLGYFDAMVGGGCLGFHFVNIVKREPLNQTTIG